MLHFRGRQRHSTPNVLNLEPGAIEAVRWLLLRHHTHRPLLHYLRNKLVCVKELSANSDKQTAWPSPPRIVCDIRHDGGLVAGEICVRYCGKLLESYRFFQITSHMSQKHFLDPTNREPVGLTRSHSWRGP